MASRSMWQERPLERMGAKRAPPLKPKPKPLSPEAGAVEGGFINDRSGQATRKVRRRLGY